MQAGHGLEPLAGEAQVRVGTGGGLHAAERQIAGLPDHRARAIGRKHRPPDLIGAHEVKRAVLVDSNNCSIRPDVFADRGNGAELFELAYSAAMLPRTAGIKTSV